MWVETKLKLELQASLDSDTNFPHSFVIQDYTYISKKAGIYGVNNFDINGIIQIVSILLAD